MNPDPRLQPAPSKTAFDYAMMTAKAGALVFPFLGAGVTLVDLVTAPLRSKRLNTWCEDLRLAFNDLSQRVDGLTPEKLVENEAFVSATLQATQAAIRTHQAEKLEALRNAVLNIALGKEPETDRQTLFLALIDRFTVSHLSVLRAFADPQGYCRQRGIAVPTLEYGLKMLATQLVTTMLPNLDEIAKSPVADRTGTIFQMTELILSDLEAANLIALDRHQQTWSVPRFSSSPDPVEVAPLITHLGEDFLAFITEPAEQHS